MRSIIVIFGLLLLMRFGALLPIGSTREGGANIATLTVSVLIGGVPLLGIFYIFRTFFRWHRNFHGRMRTDGLRLFPRDRAR